MLKNVRLPANKVSNFCSKSLRASSNNGSQYRAVMSKEFDWLLQVMVPLWSIRSWYTMETPLLSCVYWIVECFTSVKCLGSREKNWKPGSSEKTARQMETGFSTQLVRAFALGNQTGSRRHLSLQCLLFLSYNLNWHHLILTLHQGLCRLNIMLIFPCSSLLEIDAFIPTWKLVEWKPSRKWLRSLKLSETGCRVY